MTSEDSRTLDALIDDYVAALPHHRADTLPLAPDVRFTENGQELPLTAGLWATTSRILQARFARASDPDAGAVACICVVEESGAPTVLAVRLAVREGLIHEIETIACRPTGAIYDAQALLEPDPIYTTPLADGERRSRAAMIALVDAYFDAIERDDGTALSVSDSCPRRENGMLTVLSPDGEWGGDVSADEAAALSQLFGMPVVAQLGTGWLSYIDRIRDRRYPVVDEEHGVVLAAIVFDVPGGRERVHLQGGIDYAVGLPLFARYPSSLPMFELFRVRDGRIEAIDAVFDFLPFGLSMGWEHA